jgi:hypothetical protein
MIIQSKEFFLTLPSNSSVNYYPENNATRFVTQLPNRIELHDDWEVSLYEIHYPYTVGNVLPAANKVTYSLKNTADESTITKTVEIKPAYYRNVSAIHHAINSILAKETGDLNILLTESNSFTKVNGVKDGAITSLVFSDNLGLQLGFEPGTNITSMEKSPNICRLNVGFPNQLYVYCDIFESHVVGNIFAPLTRVVNFDTSWYKEKYGGHHSQSFNPPMYFPVARREFSSITVDIRDTFGDPVSFDSEVLSVVLHFRRHRHH